MCDGGLPIAGRTDFSLLSPSSPPTPQVIIEEQRAAICPCFLPAPCGCVCVRVCVCGRGTRGSRNNSSAAVAHPPSQCDQRGAHDNRAARAAAHPHSTAIMIHTKPREHLPTSTGEPHSSTNTEPKHIVESLSFSLGPGSPRPAARCTLQHPGSASVFFTPVLFFVAAQV